MEPKTLASKRKEKWHPDKIILKENIISTKEYNLIIDELVSILYDALIIRKSSPNDRYSSDTFKGGNHVA
jgi:hypothetical protein